MSLLVLPSTNPLMNLAAGIFVYLVLTNTMVICNLALVVAVIDNCTAYKAIKKACVLRKGKNSMAFLLALPLNLGLVAIEALFRYRIVRSYHDHVFGRLRISMVLEGLFITYLFSLLMVLETITSYFFIKSCDSNFGREQAEICIQIKLVKDETRISDGSQGQEDE
ncbi:unnamed protein product [Dovyalis caffra]|uniref:Uncharacterized protein n=1 Tax=Dovyalis caffra TaxID=77055 RepID=A0AAV1QSJ5_9ROSI|nr:unnamed protein product [Dovyalis caffra]